METQFDRTLLLIGEEKFNKLQKANVIVFGVGGVGGFCVEALVRAGIGNITIVDNDDVNITNINRQIIATHSNIGKSKVDCFEERIKDINPLCNVTKIKKFYLPEDNDIDLSKYDYVIDCIDTIKASYTEVQYQTSQAAVRSFDVNDYLASVAFLSYLLLDRFAGRKCSLYF